MGFGYRCTGRATPSEEKRLWANDRGEKVPRKKSDRGVKDLPLVLPPVSDERAKAFFTRPYSGPIPATSEPQARAANDNWFHDWPVRDQAVKGSLMRGSNDAETLVINNQAIRVLHEVRQLLTIRQNGGHGILHQQSSEANGPGVGMERDLDYGPSIATGAMRNLWQDGSGDNERGPWNATTIELMEKSELSVLGNKVRFLHRAGKFEFNESGHIIGYRDGKGKFRKYAVKERSKKSKKNKENNRVTNVPYGPNSLAGKTFPNEGQAANSFTAIASTNRAPISSHDPTVVLSADEAAVSHATETLADYRSRLGARLYGALVSAALGDTLDKIGREQMPGLAASDKRPGAVGKHLVVTAIELLIGYEPVEMAA
ncbi:hypothetical protein V1290_004407 [Bradyrhizobium sp. AZCC 1578]|uniref:hypothetical protein n=1 Tax=Bradyrhizobium sp. AZCC 1578 TaxID=3117027 RepID=UPI002FF340FD